MGKMVGISKRVDKWLESIGMEDYLEDLKEHKKVIQKESRRIRKEMEEERKRVMSEIMNGKDFAVDKFYEDGRYEEILVEGYDNGMMIFDEYRRIGFDIKLSRLVLYLNGKKVKGVKFNRG